MEIRKSPLRANRHCALVSLSVSQILKVWTGIVLVSSLLCSRVLKFGYSISLLAANFLVFRFCILSPHVKTHKNATRRSRSTQSTSPTLPPPGRCVGFGSQVGEEAATGRCAKVVACLSTSSMLYCRRYRHLDPS